MSRPTKCVISTHFKSDLVKFFLRSGVVKFLLITFFFFPSVLNSPSSYFQDFVSEALHLSLSDCHYKLPCISISCIFTFITCSVRGFHSIRWHSHTSITLNLFYIWDKIVQYSLLYMILVNTEQFSFLFFVLYAWKITVNYIWQLLTSVASQLNCYFSKVYPYWDGSSC